MAHGRFLFSHWFTGAPGAVVVPLCLGCIVCSRLLLEAFCVFAVGIRAHTSGSHMLASCPFLLKKVTCESEFWDRVLESARAALATGRPYM